MKLKLVLALGGAVAIVGFGFFGPGAGSRSSKAAVVDISPPQRLTHWPRLEAWLRGSKISWKSRTGEPNLPEQQLAARGRALFSLYCVQCHGADGRGNGPRAPVFHPPPRDLTSGVFKYRSTPAGQAPTRGDLFRTISDGLRGTGMAAFADLPESDRWALVEYVRTLSLVFRPPPANPLPLPPPPPDLSTPARIAQGRAAFSQLGCVTCHGQTGGGDGPAAAALKQAGHAPRNFRSEPLRTGADPEMVYRTLLTGLEGTPMGAYSGTPSNQLWDLVSYVLSLAKTERSGQTVALQQGQARHTVVEGCGCQAH